MRTVHGGFSFPIAVRIFGVVLLLIFLVSFLNLVFGIIMGMKIPFLKALGQLGVSSLFFGVGTFFFFTAYGVQLDPRRDRFREYGQYFFVKTGEWKKLSDHPHLSILTSNKTYKGRVGGIAPGGTYNFKYYELCLLSPDHRGRTIIYSSTDQKKVEKLTKEIQPYLDKELVTYSPERSERTKKRTRRRK